MKREIPSGYPIDLPTKELTELIKDYSTGATNAGNNMMSATSPTYWSDIAKLGLAEIQNRTIVELNKSIENLKVENRKQSKRNKLLNTLTIILSVITITLAILTVRYADIDYRSDKVWQNEQIMELQKQTEKLSDLIKLTQRDSVTFLAIVDINNATKDGIWLNGYIVNISFSEVKRLDGKKVKVSGIVTIQKGLKNLPKKYDENGIELIQQGRQSDTWYIEYPIIEIIED